MLNRNACVVLGNVGTQDDVPLLEAMLSNDEPIVREHALSRLASYRASTLKRNQSMSPARCSALGSVSFLGAASSWPKSAGVDTRAYRTGETSRRGT